MESEFIAKTDLRLGANYNPKTKCIDFKLYSKNATDVILCIFKKPYGEQEVCTFDMEKNKDNIFEISVELKKCKYLKKTFYYGFRVFGDNWIREEDFVPGSDIGFKSIVDSYHNRFNPNKIAYDPYGLEISHLPSRYEKYRVNEENYKDDNSKYAPKSVFTYIRETKIPKIKHIRAFKDEIIGEVHLKDLTEMLQIKEHGTYLGACKIAKILKQMGLTTIEFLPITEYDDFDNYWGYMPLSYFALSRKYLYSKKDGSPLAEFRELIKAFHQNDLKVCLDMVYNHTGEGRNYDNNSNDANLMSYALIDNNAYYKQSHDNFYTSYSGCLNDFNVANPDVQDLIIDSLEFWTRQGVDGFRFDLCAALMDTDNGVNTNYDKDNGFASHIKEKLEQRGVHVLNPDEMGEGIFLIAEPWSCGGNNPYQLGNFPSYWGEWNDVSKNTIRAITIMPHNTDPLGIRNLIEGSPFCFGDNLKSINYIASHDGFTLNDLNSYDKKSDTTKDGSDNEICSSYGGDTLKQELSIKKQIVLLLISRGIPMIQVGDMICHTKGGNNNSYNLDDRTNYINYSTLINPKERPYRIFNFIKSMINFRRKHKILTDINYKDKTEYYTQNGEMILRDNWGYWQNRGENYFSFKLNRDSVIFFATVKGDEPVTMTLPQNNENKRWSLVLDTYTDDVVRTNAEVYEGENYTLEGNSCAIFVEV